MKLTNQILCCLTITLAGLTPLLLDRPVTAIETQQLNCDSPTQQTSRRCLQAEASSLYSQGIRLYQQGKYDRAETFLKKSLAIREQLFGDNHLDVAASLDGLAVAYGVQKRFAESETLHLKALAIREQKLGKQHPEVAISLDGLAWLYQEQKQYDKAIAAIERALDIYSTLRSSININKVLLTYQLGTIYHQQGNTEKAMQRGLGGFPHERLHQEAIASYERALEMDDLYYPSLVNLGLLAYENNNREQAISYWQSALEIDANAIEPKLALAIALHQQGKTRKAILMSKTVIRQNQNFSQPKYLSENLWGAKLVADAKLLLDEPKIKQVLLAISHK